MPASTGRPVPGAVRQVAGKTLPNHMWKVVRDHARRRAEEIRRKRVREAKKRAQAATTPPPTGGKKIGRPRSNPNKELRQLQGRQENVTDTSRETFSFRDSGMGLSAKPMIARNAFTRIVKEIMHSFPGHHPLCCPRCREGVCPRSQRRNPTGADPRCCRHASRRRGLPHGGVPGILIACLLPVEAMRPHLLQLHAKRETLMSTDMKLLLQLMNHDFRPPHDDDFEPTH